MQVFRVDDMTCGHCAGAITKAVQAVDGGARVAVDLAQHLVHIEPAGASASELAEAIAEAGYTPVAVAAPATAATGPRTGACGCGGASCGPSR